MKYKRLDLEDVETIRIGIDLYIKDGEDLDRKLEIVSYTKNYKKLIIVYKYSGKLYLTNYINPTNIIINNN